MIPESHAGSPGLRVLVVDDDSDTAESMARLLSISGYQVRIALDGPQALATVHDWRPDFVMLDIGLPAMDGYEVASQIRQVAGCQGTVIIAITGYGQPEDHQRSAAVGIDHHLLKPAEWTAIVAILGGKRPPAVPPPPSIEQPARETATGLDGARSGRYRTLWALQIDAVHWLPGSRYDSDSATSR